MRRRSVYFFIKRSQLIPSMMLFDWPEHLVSIGQRASTTTAPQALLFMNSALGRDVGRGPGRAGDRRAGHGGPVRARLQARFRPRAERRKKRAWRLDFLARQRSTYAADNKPDPARRHSSTSARHCLSMSETIYIN